MSLELDEETRAALGYALVETSRHLERDRLSDASRLHLAHERDVGFAFRIDGRHRARDRAAMSARYWERKNAIELLVPSSCT